MKVLDAFRRLQAGYKLYITSAPEDESAFILKGAWKDGEGRIHYERSTIFLQRGTAMEVARSFRQRCILALAPDPDAEGTVYLLKDTAHNRSIALLYAGGYTADGEYLLVACTADADLPIDIEGDHETIPAHISFPPVPK
jgi:hypothetical protein